MPKGWKKKADNMWSRVIRQVGYCERCGVPGIKAKNGSYKNLQAHHIITKGHIPYRHLVENGVCLCETCHKFSPYAAHRDRTGFQSWLKKERPGQWQWFREHTVEKEKEVGNEIVIVYSPIEIEHGGDKKEYEVLKEMEKNYG